VYLGYENIRGIARGDSGVTPPPLCEIIFTNLTIQVWKTYKFKKSTCHKYFLVLDSYVLHLQDTTSVVDYEHVSSLL